MFLFCVTMQTCKLLIFCIEIWLINYHLLKLSNAVEKTTIANIVASKENKNVDKTNNPQFVLRTIHLGAEKYKTGRTKNSLGEVGKNVLAYLLKITSKTSSKRWKKSRLAGQMKMEIWRANENEKKAGTTESESGRCESEMKTKLVCRVVIMEHVFPSKMAVG